MFHQELHAARHQFLLAARYTQAVQLLTPTVNLVCQIHLSRTHVLARMTQRTCRHIIIIMQRSLQHTEVDADRSGNEISVRITSRTAVHRTRIHARPASQAIQGLHVFRVGKNLASSIIYNNDMQFSSLTRLAVMRSVRSDGLSRTRTG